MKTTILLLCAILLSGCCPFRSGETILYRDGYGSTVTVIPDCYAPVPYAATMPAPDPHTGTFPPEFRSGWYLDGCHQWRPQRWAIMGTDANRLPTYVAVYP